MGLLPDEEGADGRWALPAVVGDHFGPAGALIPLAPCRLPGFFENRTIPPHTPLKELFPPPQRKLRRMPPVHLQVKLAVPAVAREPRLRRRQKPCALDRRKDRKSTRLNSSHVKTSYAVF